MKNVALGLFSLAALATTATGALAEQAINWPKEDAKLNPANISACLDQFAAGTNMQTVNGEAYAFTDDIYCLIKAGGDEGVFHLKAKVIPSKGSSVEASDWPYVDMFGEKIEQAGNKKILSGEIDFGSPNATGQYFVFTSTSLEVTQSSKGISAKVTYENVMPEVMGEVFGTPSDDAAAYLKEPAFKKALTGTRKLFTALSEYNLKN